MAGKPITTIIFDFDGVLADTSPDIAHAANFVVSQLGLETLPVETIADYIGGGAEPLMRRCLLERQAEHKLAEALPMFKVRYAENYFQDTSCYPNVMQVLSHFHASGMKMAIATNKVEDLTRGILRGFQLEDCFQSVVGGDSVSHRKPHPEVVQRILTELQSDPTEALMVGDTAEDILAGKAADTRTCGVTYGYGKRLEIEEAKPDYIIHDFASLESLLSDP